MLENWKRTTFGVLTAVVITLSTGCSVSIPPGGASSATLGGGSGSTITLGVPVGQSIPLGFVNEVYEQTGIRLDSIELDDNQLQELIQTGESAESATRPTAILGVTRVSSEATSEDAVFPVQYGEDDVCRLIDRSWYSANNLPIPTEGEVLSEPGTTEGSVLLIARDSNNTGTDSRWELVPGTCESQALYLAVPHSAKLGRTEEASLETFAQFILTSKGQEALGRYAMAFPNGSVPGDVLLVQQSLADEPMTIERPTH